jgi:hypothetical protein
VHLLWLKIVGKVFHGPVTSLPHISIKLSEFPRADVEKMFDTDTLEICETCYNKLRPLLFDLLGKNNQANEAGIVK